MVSEQSNLIVAVERSSAINGVKGNAQEISGSKKEAQNAARAHNYCSFAERYPRQRRYDRDPKNERKRETTRGDDNFQNWARFSRFATIEPCLNGVAVVAVDMNKLEAC